MNKIKKFLNQIRIEGNEDFSDEDIRIEKKKPFKKSKEVNYFIYKKDEPFFSIYILEKKVIRFVYFKRFSVSTVRKKSLDKNIKILEKIISGN